MDAFLKGFYGYKNFGDEMLFFGLVNWIENNYDISKLIVESGDQIRLEDRIKDNKNYLGSILDKIEIVPINPYKIRYISHALNLLGRGEYKKLFKFFGGGEVLDDSRKFPHDGWNMALLYNNTIRRKKFVLLGGIGTVKNNWTKKLYNFVMPRAKNIICRENVSYHIAKKYNPESVLYEDFSLDVLNTFQKSATRKDTILFPYILINLTPRSQGHDSINKIKKFCDDYPKHKKIFFPCDINDDSQYFIELKNYIPDIELYNRTKHSLSEALDLFYNSDGGIGARLHFLYPLKIFEKNYQALIYEEKIEKMIG
ncbi:MAG: polysaccharide pyruvyl transferase family protein [Candidatus Absconditicoccaceae bacterium]